MKCVVCGQDMVLDDVDYNFEGNKDKYWICEDCQCSCIEEIRFFQSFQEHWHIESKDGVKDFTKRKPIIVKGKSVK